MPVKKTTATPRKKTPAKPATPKTPKAKPKEFVRNLREVELRLRFPSQKIKDGDKGTELRPRGQRGDTKKISPEDLASDYYFANLGLTFEALTVDEAREVIEKQSVNEQTAVHPALASLRNELGEEYSKDAIQLEVPYEQQGKVVGSVETDGRKQVHIRRNTGAPARADVPGSELSPEQIRDAVARQKTSEGPSAGLAGIRKVTLEDVKKT